MNAQEIIQFIGNAEKKTPVRMFVKENDPIDYGSARVFGAGDKIVFGDWKELSEIVRDNADSIEDIVIENDCRNSAVHLLDIKDLHARIEPGAFIREDKGPAHNKNKTEVVAPIVRNKAIVAPMTRPHSSAFFCPRKIPSSTVVPKARSVNRIVTECISWDPVDTAETLAASENFPTIKRSTAP